MMKMASRKKSTVALLEYSMMLPAFRVMLFSGTEGLTNPTGFITIDAHQRNPEISKYLRGRCLCGDSAG